jgi:hypothetical protein
LRGLATLPLTRNLKNPRSFLPRPPQRGNTKIDPDERIVDPNERIVGPDERIVDPDERIVDPDERIVDPNERIVDPNENTRFQMNPRTRNGESLERQSPQPAPFADPHVYENKFIFGTIHFSRHSL